MCFSDFTANGQAQARSAVFIAVVQSLEKREQFIEIFFIEADAIVLAVKLDKITGYFKGDLYPGRNSGLGIFKRVRDQVDKSWRSSMAFPSTGGRLSTVWCHSCLLSPGLGHRSHLVPPGSGSPRELALGLRYL
jgi:hypothetical protein